MNATNRMRAGTTTMVIGLIALLGGGLALAGPYASATNDIYSLYDAGVPGFVGRHGRGRSPAASGVTNNYVNPAFVGWAEEVVDYFPAPGVAASWTNTTKALGRVTGINTDIISLGDLSTNQIATGAVPGSVTLKMSTPAADGDGPDLAVFENSFMSGSAVFAELGYVEVSSDGTNFARFQSISLTTNRVGAYGTVKPDNVYNLAGKHVNAYGASWGTPFDLAELSSHSNVLNGAVNLSAIRFVRIVDIPGSGDFLDSAGNPIYDAWLTTGSGGVDLEAVGVLNSPDVINMAAPKPWSQFHGGNGHMDIWTGTIDTNAVTLLWAATNGLLRASQPVVSEDGAMVFAYGDLAHPEGQIIAYNATNGMAVWTNTVRSHVSYWSWSSPIYHRGYVYWAGGPDPFTVCKIRASDGSTNAADGAWAISLAGDIVNATPMIAGDLLYVSSYGGFDPSAACHYALSISNGAVVWSNEDGGQGQGAMAYDRDRGLIYQTIYTNNEHRLRAYNATNGAIVWTAPWAMGVGSYGAPFQCAIGYRDDRIYIQDYDFGGNGYVHVADATNEGAELWKAPTPSSGDSCPAVDFLSRLYAFGDYMDYGQTRGFDSEGGPRWTFTQGGGWQACPAWASGYVFVGDQTANQMYLVNDQDGTTALTLAGSGPVAFGDNAFYSIGMDGALYAYRADDVVPSNLYQVVVDVTGAGRAGPDGMAQVAQGGDLYAAFQADQYYHLSDITLDGISQGTNACLHMQNVQTNCTLTAVFSPNLATNGVPEAYLAAYTNTTYPTFDLAATADPDGDGLLTWEEYVAGTDAEDASSVFVFDGHAFEMAEGFVLQWSSISNRSYDIYSSTNLIDGFVFVTNVLSTPPVNTFVDDRHTNESAVFYRISVER